MKHKITTYDEKLYEALNNLKHVEEVVLEKPFNHKAVDIILRNSKNNIVAINNGNCMILRKNRMFNFDVYLKRVWK